MKSGRYPLGRFLTGSLKHPSVRSWTGPPGFSSMSRYRQARHVTRARRTVAGRLRRGGSAASGGPAPWPPCPSAPAGIPESSSAAPSARAGSGGGVGAEPAVTGGEAGAADTFRNDHQKCDENPVKKTCFS